MTRFLHAAYHVLQGERHPMSPEEITRLALSKGLLTSGGKTPAASMKARLSTEIVRRGLKSQFMRTDAGLFGLREWDLPEYSAPRLKRSLFDEDIAVFPADRLWAHITQVGISKKQLDGRTLLRDCRAMRRALAEDDSSFVQLVSVFVVKHNGRYLTFKRTKRLPENRLHGYYSLHFGGHLNPSDLNDFDSLFDPFDPHQANAFLERELREELRLKKVPHLEYAGLLYDDAREVSRQHLGIVFRLELASEEFEIGERGFLMGARFETRDEILARLDEFENWSHRLLEAAL
jgi:predicted NUDIX family phosphoesterase